MYLPILVIFHLLSPSADHAFYVSTVKIDHHPGDTLTLVEITVFSDDLQGALRNFNSTDAPVAMESICSSEREHVLEYFRKHVDMAFDSDKAVIQLSGCSITGDTHRLLFNLICPPGWKTLNIRMSYFMELFPTQSQMIHLRQGDEIRTSRLTKKKSSTTFEFTN